MGVGENSFCGLNSKVSLPLSENVLTMLIPLICCFNKKKKKFFQFQTSNDYVLKSVLWWSQIPHVLMSGLVLVLSPFCYSVHWFVSLTALARSFIMQMIIFKSRPKLSSHISLYVLVLIVTCLPPIRIIVCPVSTLSNQCSDPVMKLITSPGLRIRTPKLTSCIIHLRTKKQRYKLI